MEHGLMGVYGGTFDPVHLGHIQAAGDVLQALGMSQVRMVLSAKPPHRKPPELAACVRFELLKLALLKSPRLLPDGQELERSGPSFMVDTLRALRQQQPQQPIALILGIEAFNHLASWYQWHELIKLAHIVVTDRAGFDVVIDKTLCAFVKQHQTDDKAQLKQFTHGKIYVQKVTPLAISSTQIRKGIQRGEPVEHLLTPSVWQEINQMNFYGKQN